MSAGYSAQVSAQVRRVMEMTGRGQDNLGAILGVSGARAMGLWAGSEPFSIDEVERVAAVVAVPLLALLAPGLDPESAPVGVNERDPDAVAAVVTDDFMDPVQAVDVRVLQVAGRAWLRMAVFYGSGPLRHSVDYSMAADGDAWQGVRALLLSGRGVYVDEGHRLVLSPALASSVVNLLKVAMSDEDQDVDAWLASRLADEVEGGFLG